MNENLMLSLEIIQVLVLVTFLLLVASIVCLILHIIKSRKIIKRYQKIWSKFDNKDIEKDIEKLIKNVDETKLYCERTQMFCSAMESNINKCIQKLGLVRFDAYNSGKNGFSFALAILDNNNDGVILDSIYTREGSNIYAKEIKKGETTVELSEEERKALSIAIKNKSFM